MFFHVDGIKLDTRDIDGFGFEFKNEVLVVGIFNMVSSFPTLENITVKAHEFKDDVGLLTIFWWHDHSIVNQFWKDFCNVLH